jgi:hypothetical protein
MARLKSSLNLSNRHRRHLLRGPSPAPPMTHEVSGDLEVGSCHVERGLRLCDVVVDPSHIRQPLARPGKTSAPHQTRQLPRVQERSYPRASRADSMPVLDPERNFAKRSHRLDHSRQRQPSLANKCAVERHALPRNFECRESHSLQFVIFIVDRLFGFVAQSRAIQWNVEIFRQCRQFRRDLMR